MASVRTNVIVVFPFEAVLEDSAGIHKVLIHKVSTKGMIIEVGSPSFRAQSVVKLKFTLPVEKKYIEESCVVIKTYNQLLDEKSQKKRYLIEVHFKNIKPESLSNINDLLDKIENKKKESKGL